MDYKGLVLESLYRAEIIDDELYEKCQPSEIASLPGNLRSTDANVLQSRLDAIDGKIEDFNEKIEEELKKSDELDENTKMHQENIKYYNEQIDDYNKKEKKFEDLNDKLIKEATDSIRDIKDGWRDLTNTNTTNIQPSDNLNRAIERLGENVFDFSGVMSSGEVLNMKLIAQRVEDYIGGVSDELDDWQQTGFSLAEDIRLLADKHDVNNRSNGWVEARDEVSNLDFIPQMQRNIKESEDAIEQNMREGEKIDRNIDRYNRAIDNLNDNYKKTENRLNSIGE